MTAALFVILANKYGQPVTWHRDENAAGETCFAFLQPIVYKNRQYLSRRPTPVGRTEPGRYMYYGPADLPLEGEDGWLTLGEQEYAVCQWEQVMDGAEVSHIQAVLRKREEAAHRDGEQDP